MTQQGWELRLISSAKRCFHVEEKSVQAGGAETGLAGCGCTAHTGLGASLG